MTTPKNNKSALAASLADVRRLDDSVKIPDHNAPRKKPVRLSVDLPPLTYSAVTAFPAEMGLPEKSGKLRVPTMAVMIALAQLLEEDESGELRSKVAARVLTNLAKETRR